MTQLCTAVAFAPADNVERIVYRPAAVASFAGGGPEVEEIMAYFPALIPKSLIRAKVDIVEA